MRSALQMLAGVAVAGVVAAGSTAFTAAGLTTAGAGTANFVGGKIANLTVNGTQIDDINYGFADGAKTQINQIQLHFADTNSVGAVPVVVPAGGSWSNATTFSCTAIVASSSTCTPVLVETYSGITDLTITVA
jgi:hypothetical protein